MPDREAIQKIATRLANETDADVLLINSEIVRFRDRELLRICAKRRRRTNVLLFLVTEGGDPDAAFRMARFLQDKYSRVTVCVSGYCKSAGTLLALGAHELAFTENGELGPLDVQMAKKDDLMENESGLAVTSAMMALRDEAQVAFEHFFLSIMGHSGGRLTVFTGSEIAASLTDTIFKPITEQIDPLHMGEAWRSMRIGKDYGTRLMIKSRNFDSDALDRLLTEYPSHGFVIDKAEAATLFRAVRDCTSGEVELAEALGRLAEFPEEAPLVQFLSEEKILEAKNDDTNKKQDDSPPSSGEPSGTAQEEGRGATEIRPAAASAAASE